MSATKPRRRKKPLFTLPMGQRHLVEHFNLSESVRVEGNIVRGVVLLGLESKNGRVYEASAVKEAVARGLYNTHIYVDHITQREEQERDGVRTFRDLIGVAQDTVYKSGKVIGDIHVLESDPMGAKFLEAASRPALANAIGMSHDAVGEVEERDGQQVVTKIHDIQSADAVTRPATTKSLFESENKGARMRLHESRVRFRSSADGEEMEGTMVGEMCQVRTTDGEVVMVPKELVAPIEEMEEPPAEPEAAAEADTEGEPPAKEKEPMAETAKESARVKTLEDENRKLRESLALSTTRDVVAKKTANMTPAMAAVVREHFKGKVATEVQVAEFITGAQRIAEAHAADAGDSSDHGQSIVTNGWVDTATLGNTSEDDAALLQNAFGLKAEV